MTEWQAATVRRVLDLEPARVLEVGVGSGLILRPVAPHCTTYTGVDFSNALIQTLGRAIEGSDLHDRVELHTMAAHEVGALAPARFDTVVINSVAQYFPSIDYLIDVVRQTMRMLAPGGRILLGDIRNLRLLRAFVTAIVLHDGAEADESLATVRDMVTHQQELESELLLDPAFFTRLGELVPDVVGVDVQLKRGSFRNELTDFRYDVVLHKRGADLVSLADVPAREWSRAEDIATHLSTARPHALRVTGVPNGRVTAQVATAQRVASGTDTLVRDLPGATDLPPGIDPETLCELGAGLGYTVHPTWTDTEEGDRFDVVFLAAGRAAGQGLTDVFLTADEDERPLWQLANDPQASDRGRLSRHRTAPPRGTPAAGPHGARRRRRPGRVAVDAQRQAGHTAVARTRVRLPGGTAAGHPAGSGDGGALRRRARPGLGRRRRPLLRPRRRQHPVHPTRRQGTRGGVPDHPARRVPRPDGRGPGGPGRPERRGVPGG